MLAAIFFIAFFGTLITFAVTKGRAYWALKMFWSNAMWNLHGRRTRVKIHHRHHWGRW